MTREALFMANAMSGRVEAVRYVGLPAASRYGALLLTSLWLSLSSRLAGVDTPFASAMLNLQYFVCIRLLANKN